MPTDQDITHNAGEITALGTPPVQQQQSQNPEGQVDMKTEGGKPKPSVPAVTEQAKIVLEQFLKRSLSLNDASPMGQDYQYIKEMEVIVEPPSLLPRTDSYQLAARDQPIRTDSLELDVVDAHVIHSPSSYKESVGATSSSQSQALSYTPLSSDLSPLSRSDYDSPQAGQGFMYANLDDHDDATATYSDKESSDSDGSTKSGQYRKKKSLFKRASERLRQSFRRKSKERPKDGRRSKSYYDSPRSDPGAYNKRKNKTDDKKKKSSSLRRGLKLSYVSKSSKETTPEVVECSHSHTKSRFHKEIRRSGKENGATVLLTEDTSHSEDFTRESSPAQHREVKIKVKESKHLDNKAYKKSAKGSAFESLLAQIRRSGRKLQRRLSRESSLPKRSRSDDAIGHKSRKSSSETSGTCGGKPHMYMKLETEVQPQQTIERSFQEVIVPKGSADYDSSENDRGVSEITQKSEYSRLHAPPSGSPDSKGDIKDLKKSMKLDGLVKTSPATKRSEALGAKGQKVVSIDVVKETDVTRQVSNTADGGKCVSTTVTSSTVTLPTNVQEDGEDVVDYALLPKGQPPSSKGVPKTEAEKEIMYEKIANRLAQIADVYNAQIGSGETSPATSPQATGTSSNLLEPPARSERANSLELKIAAVLRDKGDNISEAMPADVTMPIAQELVKQASYQKFKQLMGSTVGNEPGVQQLAMLFGVTRSAVNIAGASGALAVQIKEMTLRYFEDTFAGWIVGQGGWESMMEDTEHDLTSEVD